MRNPILRTTLATTLFCWGQAGAGQGDMYVLKPPSGLELSFGQRVSGAGDVNGDGYPDFLVAAPACPVSGPGSGLVMLYSGQDGTGLYPLIADTAGDSFGRSLSDLGDANGDGFADVLVGAPSDYPDTTLGYARIFSGSTGITLHTWYAASMYDSFGASVSGAGDLNNDGFPDLLVGASMNDAAGQVDSGNAQVFSLQTGLLYTFNGHAAGDQFGSSVSDAGDINNDGFPDIIVGAPGDDIGGNASGSAEVFSGKDGSSIYRFPGAGTPWGLGRCVSDAGDVDADGCADVIVGGHSSSNLVYANVYSGKDGSTIHSFGGVGVAGEGGHAVSGVGDINQDGFADVLLATSLHDAVVARSGNDGAELFRMYGDIAGDTSGCGLGDADDVNGDGIPEMIVGFSGGTLTPYAKVITTDCGTIQLVGQGCPGSTPAAPTLEITGCPVPGASLFLALYAGGFLPTPALLFAGAGTTSLPMGGGCSLLVQPPLVPVWVMTGMFGVLGLEARIPITVPLGAFAVQAFIPDPAAPAGFRNSNAVLVSVE
ncbi:MAG: FG-GAP repeat protein [Planctomycetes bacterium]|nr:FG-GAP repeat protein [Planctomycetota bacterium]